MSDQFLGLTPARKGHPIQVPEEKLWYVRPKGSLSAIQFDRLVQELKKEGVPGIDLSDHWELSNESMAHLRPLSKLKYLDISRTKITDRGLSSLQSCPELSVLFLPSAVTDQGIESLLTLKNLREINLDQTQVSDRGLQVLSQLPLLENLDLTSTRVTDAGAPFLGRMASLRRLVLNGRMTQASAPSLGGLKHLIELDLRQAPMGEEGLRVLGTLPSLRILYLGTDVTDAGLKALSKSRSLQALDLSRSAISDAGVESLAKIKSLQDVALSQTAIGNASLESLAKLSDLRMLELSDTQVTIQGLAPLRKLKKLEVLSFSWKTISREDIQQMSEFKQLKMIVLNGTPLSEATMAQLRRLGTPSPWEPIAGLERARQREPRPVDTLALSAPVASPKPLSGSGSLSPHFTPAVAPAHRMKADPIRTPAVLSDRKSTPSPFSTERLSETKAAKKPVSFTKKEEKLAALPVQPETISAPVPVKAIPEENLLKVIALQSSPERSGGFSGFSGMRQLRQTATLASLEEVGGAASKPAVPVQEDKPENSVGEFSVNAIRSR